MKIFPVGAELFPSDRHGEAISRFSQYFERAQMSFVEVLLFSSVI